MVGGGSIFPSSICIRRAGSVCNMVSRPRRRSELSAHLAIAEYRPGRGWSCQTQVRIMRTWVSHALETNCLSVRPRAATRARLSRSGLRSGDSHSGLRTPTSHHGLPNQAGSDATWDCMRRPGIGLFPLALHFSMASTSANHPEIIALSPDDYARVSGNSGRRRPGGNCIYQRQTIRSL